MSWLRIMTTVLRTTTCDSRRRRRRRRSMEIEMAAARVLALVLVPRGLRGHSAIGRRFAPAVIRPEWHSSRLLLP
jgi:hypothetical protein